MLDASERIRKEGLVPTSEDRVHISCEIGSDTTGIASKSPLWIPMSLRLEVAHDMRLNGRHGIWVETGLPSFGLDFILSLRSRATSPLSWLMSAWMVSEFFQSFQGKYCIV